MEAALEHDCGVTYSATSRECATDPIRRAEYRRHGWRPGEALADRFQSFVHADPDRLSLIDDHGIVLSRAGLWHAAASLGRSLASVGIGSGDAIVIYLPNTAAWQVSLLACLQLGAVPATLPATTDQDTLAYVCGLVGARAIISTDSHGQQPLADRARAAAAATDSQAGLFIVNSNNGVECREWAGGSVPEQRAPDGVEHLMFTSSTTGMPKAVMHTSDTLGAANLAFAERFGLSEDTPLFMPSPLGHSVGAWHGGRLSMFLGATLVLQDKWDPQRGLELVDAYSCEFTVAATPFLKDLVDAPWDGPRAKLATLRTLVCGGAPVPPSLLEQAANQLPSTFVTVLWGMTEGTGTTCLPNDPMEKLTTTAGTPVSGLELAIRDADQDGVGELVMRGPEVFVGYLGQEELYRELLTADGYFHTGDQATLDVDGYLHLTGRLKDMIIRGGVNISPVPIEDAIAAHPAVHRVAVIGHSDERLGERICAVIVPDGAPPSLEELNSWLSSRGLTRRKLPELLRVVDEMPATAIGKIRKADLQRQLAQRS